MRLGGCRTLPPAQPEPAHALGQRCQPLRSDDVVACWLGRDHRSGLPPWTRYCLSPSHMRRGRRAAHLRRALRRPVRVITHRPDHTGPSGARRQTQLRRQARPGASHEVPRPCSARWLSGESGPAGTTRPPMPRRPLKPAQSHAAFCGQPARCRSRRLAPSRRRPCLAGLLASTSQDVCSVGTARHRVADPGGSCAGGSRAPAFRSPHLGQGNLVGSGPTDQPDGALGTDALRSVAPAAGEQASRPPRTHMPLGRRPSRLVLPGDHRHQPCERSYSRACARKSVHPGSAAGLLGLARRRSVSVARIDGSLLP